MVTSPSNAFDSACSFELAPRTARARDLPAWLLHWVTAYAGGRPRISVSFHAR